MQRRPQWLQSDGEPSNPIAKEAPALMRWGPRLSHCEREPYPNTAGDPMPQMERKPPP